MSEQNTLREAINEVTIEGLLVEMNLEEKVSQAKENYITGKVLIETAENEVHTVEVYCKELKKDGTENKLYKGLQTVVREYVSVAKVGREEADRVKIEGKFASNDYVGGDGQLRSFPKITSNRINRVKNLEKYDPRADFNVEMFIKTINEEIDKDENETGRIKINAYIPVFGGRIVPIEFVVDEVAEYIKDNFENGQTSRFNGTIINRVEVIETKKNKGFGKSVKKTTDKYVREYLIEGGNEEPYEEDDVNTYNAKTIKKALTEREVYLEGLVKESEEKSKNGNKGNSKKEEKKGFGKPTKKEESTELDISSDDLPF